RPARAGRPSDEAELPVRLERRDADADETERSWPVGEGAVEEPARERPDLAAVVGARGEGRGAAADREVAVAELRRHRASAPAVGAQELGHPLRHRPQLVVEPVPVGEVDLERLLLADRDARRREVERTRIDALRAVAKEPADLSGNEPRKLCLAEARERADGLDARVAETLLGAWSHAGQEPDGERGEERRLAARRHDGQAARLPAVARHLRDHLRRRDAERARERRRGPHGGLHRLAQDARLEEIARELAEVEVPLVDPGPL